MANPEAKHKAILAAAAEIFLRDGYGASIDAVAAAAGVSKQTVYNHFGSKDALFQAIMGGIADELTMSLSKPSPGEGPAEVLTRLGRQALTLGLAPAMLDLHRTVVAESRRFPELARQAYDAGARSVVDRLAAYLEAEHRLGRLSIRNPEMAAEQFLGMIGGHLHLRALLGYGPPSDGSVLEEYVGSAVETFLRAHAPAAG